MIDWPDFPQENAPEIGWIWQRANNFHQMTQSSSDMDAQSTTRLRVIASMIDPISNCMPTPLGAWLALIDNYHSCLR